MTPNEIRVTYKQHKNIIGGGGWLRLKPGSVTDDTEMSLALGNALILARRVDAVAIADAFSNWMRSKLVDIGSTVRRGILHYRNHSETSVEKCEHTAGNDACMRCLPIAFATLGCEQADIVAASQLQVHITHNCELSDAGTEHIIGLLQKAIMGVYRADLEDNSYAFTSRYTEFRLTGKAIGSPSGYIVDTIQAVLQAFYSTDSFESCLIDVVNCGRDAIPSRWLKKLDQDVKKLCEFQAEKLLEIAPISVPVH